MFLYVGSIPLSFCLSIEPSREGCNSPLLFVTSLYISSFSTFNNKRLERRFFDRVAQTNRVKSSGVVTTLAPGGATMAGIGPAGALNIINFGGGGGKMMDSTTMEFDNVKPTPPWLRAPRTYKPKGKFARKFVVATTTTTVPPPRCMPMPMTTESSSTKSKHGTTKSKRKSDLTSTTASTAACDGIPRTESALEQLARTASGERLLYFITLLD